MLRTVATTLIAGLIAAFTLSAASTVSAANAAIAFSQSTGNYGYSEGYYYLAGAKGAAMDNCPGCDAKIVVWASNGWCALAVGDDNGYGYGWASCKCEAERLALEQCGRNTCNGRIVVSVYSGCD